jgi:site-specific recombinase XerD
MQTDAVRVLHGKDGKYRVASCGAKARRALLKYRRTLTNVNQHIFPLTKSGIQSLFARMSKRAGILVTPHVLRRTFATLALRSGMPLAQLSALLGHASLEMTAICSPACGRPEKSASTAQLNRRPVSIAYVCYLGEFVNISITIKGWI